MLRHLRSNVQQNLAKTFGRMVNIKVSVYKIQGATTPNRKDPFCTFSPPGPRLAEQQTGRQENHNAHHGKFFFCVLVGLNALNVHQQAQLCCNHLHQSTQLVFIVDTYIRNTVGTLSNA